MKTFKGIAFLLIAACFVLVVTPYGNTVQAHERQGIEAFTFDVDIQTIDTPIESPVFISVPTVGIFNDYTIIIEESGWYCTSNLYVYSYTKDNADANSMQETNRLYGTNYFLCDYTRNENHATAKNLTAYMHSTGSEVSGVKPYSNKI